MDSPPGCSKGLDAGISTEATAITTIAYRAGEMAADTQATSGTRKFRCHKISRLKCGGLIGITGSLSSGIRVRRWAEAGFPADDKPEFDGAAEVECLVVRGDGTVWCVDDELEPMEFTDEFIAIGSGGGYAVAAMECGRSPEEAVRVAAKFDAATSEPIETWRIEPKAKKAKAKIRGRKP